MVNNALKRPDLAAKVCLLGSVSFAPESGLASVLLDLDQNAIQTLPLSCGLILCGMAD